MNISRFMKTHESEYIDTLAFYKGWEAFESVHAQITKQLSSNMKIYGITKSIKSTSEHIFGDLDVIQWWNKL